MQVYLSRKAPRVITYGVTNQEENILLKKQMKKLFIIPLVLLIVIFSTGTAFAVVDDSLGNEATPQDDKEKKNEFKCEITSSKMDTLELRYKKAFEKHQGTYKNIITRINEVLLTFEEEGYDTENAKKAVNGFEEKVNNVQTEYDGFVFQMQQAKDSLCEDNNQGDFKQSLNKARNQLKLLRQEMLALKSSYEKDVKPALLELREQIRDAEDSRVPSDVEVN